MRYLVIAAIFMASFALASGDVENPACDGWSIDRTNLETLITAQAELRDALKDVDVSNPASPLAQELVYAMSLILKGANEAVDVTGQIHSQVCP